MTKIDFNFEGYVLKADIKIAYNPKTDSDEDVSSMNPQKLCSKLQDGDLLISLGDFLYKNNKEVNIEINKFEPSEL